MVRALLWEPAPLKLETRRIATFQNARLADGHMARTVWQQLDLSRAVPVKRGAGFVCPWTDGSDNRQPIVFPRVAAGDRIFVKETWAPPARYAGVGAPEIPRTCRRFFRADHDGRLHGEEPAPWRPSIFMPAWASRIWLTVRAVEAQRLHDITPTEARREGIPETFGAAVLLGLIPATDSGAVWHHRTPVEQYAALWGAINGAGSWAENPVVFVYRFTVEVTR